MNNMNLLLIIKDELKRQDTERRETNQQSKAEQKKTHKKAQNTHKNTKQKTKNKRNTGTHNKFRVNLGARQRSTVSLSYKIPGVLLI